MSAAAAAAASAAPAAAAAAPPSGGGGGDYTEALDVAYQRAVRALREGFSSGGGWQFHAREKEVLVYRKKFLKSRGRGVWACKGVGLLAAPAGAVKEVFSDLKYRTFWDEFYESGYVVEQVDRHTSVSYVALRGVWPVKPRDLVVVGRTRAFSNGALLVYSTSVPHPDVPPKKKYVRSALHFCAVYVEPLDAANCKVTYIVSSDPRGSLPKVMVNMFLTKTPLAIAKVRQLLLDRPALINGVSTEADEELVRVAREEGRAAPGAAEDEEEQEQEEEEEEKGDEAAADVAAAAVDGAGAAAAGADDAGGEQPKAGGQDATKGDGRELACAELRALAAYRSQPNKYDDELAEGLELALEAVDPKAPGWNFHSRVEDVDIFVKPAPPGSNLNASKGVGVLPFPAEVVKHVFGEMSIKKRWDEMLDVGRRLEAVDTVTAASYLALKGQWPVAARDMCVVGRVVVTDDGSFLIFSRSVERADCPPVRGKQRGTLVYGATKIQPLGPNKCRVSYTAGFDPCGSIPTFIINAANVKSPLAIARVRDLLQSDPALVRECLEESRKITAELGGGGGDDEDDEDDDEEDEDEDGGEAAPGGESEAAALAKLAADPGLAAWRKHPLQACVSGAAPIGHLALRLVELRGADRLTFGLREVVPHALRLFCRVTRGADVWGETRRRRQEGDAETLRWPRASVLSAPVQGTLGGEPVRVALLARCRGEDGAEDVLLAEVTIPLERLAAAPSGARRVWLPVRGPHKEDDEDPPLLACDVELAYSRVADLLSPAAGEGDGAEGAAAAAGARTAPAAGAGGAPAVSDTDRFVDAALELADVAQPLQETLAAGTSLLTWQSPVVSGAYLVALLALVLLAPELVLPAAAVAAVALVFALRRPRRGDAAGEASAVRAGLAPGPDGRALSFKRREEAAEARRLAVREVGADMERAARALHGVRRFATAALGVLVAWLVAATLWGPREAATAGVAVAGLWSAPAVARARALVSRTASNVQRARQRRPL